MVTAYVFVDEAFKSIHEMMGKRVKILDPRCLCELKLVVFSLGKVLLLGEERRKGKGSNNIHL